MKTLFAFAALFWAVALSACLPSAQRPGLTASDAPRIGSCQSIAVQHNGLLVSSIVTGGLATGLTTVGASLSSSNATLKDGITAGGAGAAAITGALAAITALAVQAFNNGQCSQVVGDLPVAPAAPVSP